MARAAPPSLVRGVDFVSLPTRDLEAAMRFYSEVLGLRRSVHRPEYHYAEFEPGDVTIGVMQTEAMGLPYQPNRNPIALHVDDVAAARAALEERGVAFEGDILETGVCHMTFFADPDGNALMLHHRYAPRTPGA